MKKRRGFFIAGLILIIVIIGVIYLYSNNILFSLQTQNYNLNEKYQLKGNVVEYGTYKQSTDVDEFLYRFNEIFASNLGKGKLTYFIYGNSKEIKVSTYEEAINGEVNLVGMKKTGAVVKEYKYTLRNLIPQENEVNVIIGGQTYNFKLEQGENLYFIISEDVQ